MIGKCLNHCELEVVNSLGRKRLNIAIKNIFDVLHDYKNNAMTTEKISCSLAYIYKGMKSKDLNPQQLIETKV